MKDIIHFDACCYLGRHVHMPEGQPETAEEILDAIKKAPQWNEEAIKFAAV